MHPVGIVEFELRKPPVSVFFLPNPATMDPILTATILKILCLIWFLRGRKVRVCAFEDFCSGIVISVKRAPIVLKLEREREREIQDVKKQRKEQRETEAKQSMKVITLTGSFFVFWKVKGSVFKSRFSGRGYSVRVPPPLACKPRLSQ